MTVVLPASARGGGVVDLHMHSNASDGALTPTEVSVAASALGVRVIALTDHDTVAGIAAARAAAADGLRVVAGVELSAHEGEQELHLLGLHLTDVQLMDERLAEFRVARRSRAEQIVRKLNAIGVRITFDDVLAVAGDAAIGRPHVARAMVENGWARDLRDAFDRYLGAGRPAYEGKKRLSIPDAIALVHECGGVAVFAHPGSDATVEHVAHLVDAGLDGLEVVHPSHSAEDRVRILALVEHFGLVPSGGSDSHGAPDGSRAIGSVLVPEEWVVRQEERAAQVRKRVSSA